MGITRTTPVWAAALALLAFAGSLAAHHSLVSGFDLSTPIWIKGKVVRFEAVNPHSRIYLEQTDGNGEVHQWIADGPSPLQFQRRGFTDDTVKIDDMVEVCGFESLKSQDAHQAGKLDSPDYKLPGRFMNGTLLLLADNQEVVLSNYGQLQRCMDREGR